MSYERGKHYRDLALIEGINLLVNMVKQTREDKESLKKIHKLWIEFGDLSFADQIELIYGTATDKKECRFLVKCITKLNKYRMTDYPNHIGRIKMLVGDVLNAINMAIMADIHIWKRVQVDAIQLAFRSGRVAKASPYFRPKRLERKKSKKTKALEYIPDEEE